MLDDETDGDRAENGDHAVPVVAEGIEERDGGRESSPRLVEREAAGDRRGDDQEHELGHAAEPGLGLGVPDKRCGDAAQNALLFPSSGMR